MMEVKGKKLTFSTFAKKYGTVVALLVICLFFSVKTKAFLTPSNIITVVRQISMLATLGAGLTIVMITGRIDLSIGYGTSLLGIIVATLMVDFGLPIPVAALITILFGALIGLLNGSLVAYAGIHDFIGTLATGFLLSGINQAYTKGHPVSGIPDGFKIFGDASFLGIPSMIYIMAAWLAVIALILGKTRFGRHVYAIGGNKEAAMMSGVNVKFNEMMTFTFCGVGMALTALILTSRMGSAHPTAGDAYQMNAIARVYLGSTAFKEGEPNLLGTIIGALIIGVLKNGMTLMNIDYYYQDIAQGILILFAVAVTSMQRSRKK